ncbi:hypothetical protein SAMN05444279_102244 [Ruegeria intermedia]|uniref:Uncharacterized protein n=1 Tax=Ruegeria intermedia TaxID=996115 RepID=A0A1M4TMF3_9RHOB|nr:hypothetical protein [Ruegeria intermedia]SHE45585.1 hypothetical protein SAMN05444279_102244 [Ruegeria intermedia]
MLGPILDVSYGGYAPLVMLALCALAYAFGGAIRFNIAQNARRTRPFPLLQRLETAASAVLAFAYFISVAHYLNLFGAFGVSLTQLDDACHANLLTTAVFTFILAIGWTRGFAALERLEQVSVGIKLAIIAGLIIGLAAYFGKTAGAGALAFDPPQVTGWAAITLAAGLLITVQGFETSRYLGATYDAPVRVRSMRMAQGISTVIYMVYVVLLTYAVDTDPRALDETTIIDMMHLVAPILPLLLVAAALSAQFSAAIADTAGSGGLIAEVTAGRIPEKLAYALPVGLGILLTWSFNIFEIISYASRAFALYYAIQALIAAVSAHQGGRPLGTALGAGLSVLGLAIAVFGTPVE